MSPRLSMRVVPWAAQILLTVWLAGDLARLTWILAGEPPRPRLAEAPLGVTTELPSPPVDLEAIVSLAPFGADAAEQPAEGNPTSIPLTLQGVLLAADPVRSQAVIMVPGGKPRRYLPGDALPGGPILVRVEAARAVLRVNGREETLAFPAHSGAGGGLAAQVLGTGAPAASKNETPIDEAIGQVRERIVQNPKTFLTEMGVEAGADGYRISEAANGMTRQAGLKPGDVVSSVNGVAVGDLENDRRLFEEVVASGLARVELKRDGHPVVLTFPLR